MSSIDQAIAKIDNQAAEGDLSVDELHSISTETLADPVQLPDGRTIYPPMIGGKAIHEIAKALTDTENPASSRFVRLVGPPGTGKSQIGRLIGHTLWTERGREVTERDGQPFYGYEEMSPGPSSDEYFFRYEYVPQGTEINLVDSAFVRAMREGYTVMIDEVNTARDVALLSINATLDGRLTLYLPATGETVVAQPGFCVILAYNPGLVGATDLPAAWFSRFPAPLEITSNWAALIAMGVSEELVNAAARLDDERLAGQLVWTPQFREIESFHVMREKLDDDRLAIAMFVSNVDEQLQSGSIGVAEAEAVARMFDTAGFGDLKIPAGSRERVPNLGGYARAVSL